MEDFNPIEEITPADVLAEYADADESYAVQNEVEGE